MTNAIASVTKNAGQKDKPWLVMSDHAMKVVNIAISPWAKFTTPVARWMRTSARARLP